MVAAFNTRPYAFFGMPAIKKSLDMLEAVKDATESVPAMEQESIDYLIRRGVCICGTRLDPHTAPYNLVMAERKKLPPEQIGTVVSNYKNKAEGYLAGSESYLKEDITYRKAVDFIYENAKIVEPKEAEPEEEKAEE